MAIMNTWILFPPFVGKAYCKHTHPTTLLLPTPKSTNC